MHDETDDRIQYSKKKDKQATIKAQQNEAAGDGQYKSSTISVASGEPPTSVSNPMPPRKPKAKKAQKASTSGARERPTAVSRPGAAKPTAPAAINKTAPAPAPVARAPPAVPASPAKEMYKALYNFAGQAGEMNLTKGEQVEVKQKDDNGTSQLSQLTIGWWMVTKDGQEGWAPSNYLKLVEAPPPPPVARRPPPAPAAPRPPVSTGSSPAPSRPTSAIGKGPAPAPKPKPSIPAKPAANGRPPVPSTARPVPAAAPARSSVAKPAAASGQLDLAAA